MRIVIATDKFKGSLSAADAAQSLGRGIKTASPNTIIEEIPIADGGEGTLDAAIAAGFTKHVLAVAGPTGMPVEAGFATRGREAVIELAQASGLALLPDGNFDPLGATSFGTGQLIRAALDRGCTRIVVGAGGSANTDGGAGLLTALGAEFLDPTGTPIARGGAALAESAASIWKAWTDASARHGSSLPATWTTPSWDRTGAAAVFGPQKGASKDEVKQLDRAMAHLAGMLKRRSVRGRPRPLGPQDPARPGEPGTH